MNWQTLRVRATYLAIGFAIGLLAGVYAPGALADGPSLKERLVHAIGVIDGNPADFTKSGKPRVKSLERVLGLDISAADRDQAWKTYKNPAPAACPIVEASTCPSVDPELQAKLDASLAALAAEQLKSRDLATSLREARSATEEQTARAKKAEGKIAESMRIARRAEQASETAVSRAAKREAAAEAKTRALLSGRPVCQIERGELQGKVDEWWASEWRESASSLLECLSIGE